MGKGYRSKKIKQLAESGNGNIYQSGRDILIEHLPSSSKSWYEKLGTWVGVVVGILTIYITIRFTIPSEKTREDTAASFLFHGFVVDAQGEYIPHARIIVKFNADGPVIGEGTTEQSGYFEFEVSAAREMIVWVTIAKDSTTCFAGRRILDSNAKLVCQ